VIHIPLRNGKSFCAIMYPFFCFSPPAIDSTLFSTETVIVLP
jgi:hypothetical protein